MEKLNILGILVETVIDFFLQHSFQPKFIAFGERKEETFNNIYSLATKLQGCLSEYTLMIWQSMN